ncbi:phosphatase PAP2 family protein [Psychroserpens sp.]|uniref:phosphatase PAP2 family protein n=1 Tax=Psychroserpens sp. TaxID=2020870 RepID=UPI002B26DB2D|nr:phosphatase PAP2 family protein [Psychroserpens sp.]
MPSIKRTDKTLLQKSIVPAVLIGSSLLITNSNFEKQFQIDIRNEVGNDFHTNLDDYLWYVPLVEMYAADIIGIEAKHHWFDQSKNAFISHLVNKYTTNAFKGLIVKTRPNGYNKNSFPSGHTSKAFTSATVLYEEFKDTSPLLAYSGYIFASSTAVLRIANNAHYVSDVLIGAGLGILITKIVYHFDYLFDWNPFKGKENVMIAPTINNETVGLIGIIQL